MSMICNLQRPGSAGMTLLELMVSCSILIVLATVSLPLARVTVKREKETRLRNDLREMRDAIDRYKVAADKNQLLQQPGTEDYPQTLQALVDGVQESGQSGRIVKFLREIPVDPMTGQADWKLRSVQDDADSPTWGGQDVFDVHSESTDTSLNGTKYSDW